MSDLNDQLTNKDFYSKVLAYQANMSIPVAVSEYYILAEDYFVNLSNMQYFFTDLENRAPKDVIAYIEKPQVLNTACFNISKYLGRSFTQNDIETIGDVLGNFMTVFYAATNASCALCASTPADPSQEAEILLLCYPEDKRNGATPSATQISPQEIKSVFFALLWDMGFLSEKQLYDNNIMMGTQGHKIQTKKASDDLKPSF